MKKLFVLVLLLFSLEIFQSQAQCAMCRRVAETNYKQGNNAAMKRGKSLNNGILYLLSVPYLIGAVGALALYKNRKRN
jgi:hypothetical protein